LGWGHAKPLDGASPGQLRQALLRCHAVRHRFLGIFVTQFVKAETAAFDDVERAGERCFMVAEQPRHLGSRLQMALGIRHEAKPGLMD
jgi:hypothetical protein